MASKISAPIVATKITAVLLRRVILAMRALNAGTRVVVAWSVWRVVVVNRGGTERKVGEDGEESEEDCERVEVRLRWRLRVPIQF